MTIRIPPENILDKVLKLFGKERQVIMPEEAGKIYEDKGPYVQKKPKGKDFLMPYFVGIDRCLITNIQALVFFIDKKQVLVYIISRVRLKA